MVVLRARVRLWTLLLSSEFFSFFFGFFLVSFWFLTACLAVIDLTILREGLKLARKIGNSAPLSSSTLTEFSPGSSVQTDDEWDAWLKGQIGTEFHPSCSCAMMPLESGGVVDARLMVYGTGEFYSFFGCGGENGNGC